MKIRELRLKKGLATIDVIVKLREVDNRVTHNVYFLLEQGVCLPTVEQFRVLCRTFHVKSRTLATREETSFNVRPKRKKENKELYQIHGRVSKVLTGSTEDLHRKIKACGYANISDWLQCCMIELNIEYEKSRRDVGASSAAVQEN